MLFFFFFFQLDNSIVEYMLVKEFRVKLNNPSHPESDDSKREHVINIDGEICPLKHPVFTVRCVFGAVYKIFGVCFFFSQDTWCRNAMWLWESY